LIVAVLSYVWLEETLPIAITMSIIVALTLFPVSYFILIRPIFVDRQD
jgi:multidrug efflux pump subunit AcrB